MQKEFHFRVGLCGLRRNQIEYQSISLWSKTYPSTQYICEIQLIAKSTSNVIKGSMFYFGKMMSFYMSPKNNFTRYDVWRNLREICVESWNDCYFVIHIVNEMDRNNWLKPQNELSNLFLAQNFVKGVPETVNYQKRKENEEEHDDKSSKQPITFVGEPIVRKSFI